MHGVEKESEDGGPRRGLRGRFAAGSDAVEAGFGAGPSDATSGASLKALAERFFAWGSNGRRERSMLFGMETNRSLSLCGWLDRKPQTAKQSTVWSENHAMIWPHHADRRPLPQRAVCTPARVHLIEEVALQERVVALHGPRSAGQVLVGQNRDCKPDRVEYERELRGEIDLL